MQAEAQIPTDKEKIAQYERFLHAINMSIMCHNHKRIEGLIHNADMWSYAHRYGNGEIEESEQDKIIARKFWKLCETEN
jgi:hypothetical protein